MTAMIKRKIRFQESALIKDTEKSFLTNAKSSQEVINENVQENINENVQEDTNEDVQEAEITTRTRTIFRESRQDAINRLRNCIESIVTNERRYSNMIGVFGINSDNVVNAVCRYNNIKNIKYIGTIEYNSSMDIYNYIAALMLDFVTKEFNSSRHIELDYEVRSLYKRISELYYNDNDFDNGYNSALQQFTAISNKYQRDKKILSTFRQIANITNYHFREESVFQIVIELQDIDYKILNMLSKLNSLDVILVVYCIYDIDSAEKMIEARSQGAITGRECINKFISPNNIIIAS